MVTEEQVLQLISDLFEPRFVKKHGRALTDQERDTCYFTVLGIMMREGYDAAKEYVITVKVS